MIVLWQWGTALTNKLGARSGGLVRFYIEKAREATLRNACKEGISCVRVRAQALEELLHHI